MKYDPDRHHRRTIRLKNYDYTRVGEYFVTLRTQNSLHQFGEIEDGQMILSQAGYVVAECCRRLSPKYPHIILDTSVVMPDHWHGILIIQQHDRTHEDGSESRPIHDTPMIRKGGVSPPSSPSISIIGVARYISPYNTPGMNDKSTDDESAMVSMMERGGGTPPLRTPPRPRPRWDDAPSAPVHSVQYPTLGNIVAFFKYETTKIINELYDSPGQKLWQRNYYEHVIRNEREMAAIRQYILNNPMKWCNDGRHRN